MAATTTLAPSSANSCAWHPHAVGAAGNDRNLVFQAHNRSASCVDADGGGDHGSAAPRLRSTGALWDGARPEPLSAMRGLIRVAGRVRSRQNAYAVNLGPVGASDDLQARYGSDPVTISAVARGGDRVDAGDKTAAEAKGARMDLPACVFDAFHEDAALCLRRRSDRTRSGPRSCLTRLDESGHGYILASVNRRAAPASCRMIGREVS